MRAKARMSGRGRTLARVRARRGEGDGPDGRVPHGSESERGRGGADWARVVDRPGKRSWAGSEFWAEWRKKEKERESWAGLKQERGGEKVLHFLEKKQTHSIKIRIQGIQI